MWRPDVSIAVCVSTKRFIVLLNMDEKKRLAFIDVGLKRMSCHDLRVADHGATGPTINSNAKLQAHCYLLASGALTIWLLIGVIYGSSRIQINHLTSELSIQ